jgi:hypothetical protein
MSESGFSIAEAVKFGWSTVIGNLGLWIVALLIVLGVNVFPVFFDSIIVYIVAWFFTMVVGMGMFRLALRFVDGGRGELVDLFSTITLVPSYLIASILLSIVASIGFLLLIIPGIYLAVRLHFYGWAIIDKEIGPLAALDRSWAITRGAFWNIFLLMIVLFLINLLGMLVLAVGLIVTAPLSLVALGYAYRRLEEK